MISVDKPGSPSEILEHHGVKGQKWGVRKKTGAGLTRSSREFAGKFPTSKARTQEIKRARAQVHIKEAKIYAEPSKAKRKKMYASYLKDPDRPTALRMTRGEKAVAAIVAVGIPGPGTGAILGYTGTTVAIRKGIERSQRIRAGK